jgi:hypothetical protein
MPFFLSDPMQQQTIANAVQVPIRAPTPAPIAASRDPDAHRLSQW